MNYIQPWFYDQFQCIAGACTDTCCAGWEIYIDEATLARYQADTSTFGLFRQSKITQTPDGALFARDPQGRCPFLTADNLCAMILADGPKSLCHICTHHPRFYNVYGAFDEQGIGLCCPEASRLLLSQPLRFQRRHQPCQTPHDPMAETIFELRGLLQEILLDQTLSLQARHQEALAVATQAQTQLYHLPQPQAQQPQTKLQLWQILLKTMLEMEPIDQAWTPYLQTLQQELPLLLAKELLFLQQHTHLSQTYGNISAYILYRHFHHTLEDGQLLPRLIFALLSTLFVHLCYLQAWCNQGASTPTLWVHHLKNWSKQMEYSDENAHLFLTFCETIDLSIPLN